MAALHRASQLVMVFQQHFQGFPDSSVGKESTCDAGDPGSIPESGRSPGEGRDYPLQYSGLENSMEESMGSQSQTRLNYFHLLTRFRCSVSWFGNSCAVSNFYYYYICCGDHWSVFYYYDPLKAQMGASIFQNVVFL